jgi:hypothetical protein
MRDILSPTVVSAGSSRVTRLSHQRVNESSSNTANQAANQAARLRTSLPLWMNALKAVALPKRQGLRARLKGLGIIAGIAIPVAAIFALTRILKHIDYAEVLEAVRRTNASHIVLARMLVAVSYGSLTLYDVLVLRTIERADVPYRIAALASFTSYPIAHGVGAVSLISPVIRYRLFVARSWRGRCGEYLLPDRAYVLAGKSDGEPRPANGSDF